MRYVKYHRSRLGYDRKKVSGLRPSTFFPIITESRTMIFVITHGCRALSYQGWFFSGLKPQVVFFRFFSGFFPRFFSDTKIVHYQIRPLQIPFFNISANCHWIIFGKNSNSTIIDVSVSKCTKQTLWIEPINLKNIFRIVGFFPEKNRVSFAAEKKPEKIRKKTVGFNPRPSLIQGNQNKWVQNMQM